MENRLVTASGTRSATLTYDPLGRLWQVAGTTTTRFLYDGDELVAEYDSSNNLLRRYVHGPGTDEPLIVDEGSAFDCSGTKVLHTDRQGSMIATADCWGARQAVNAYDEYGAPGSGNAAVNAGGRFGYTGQIWIPELGLWHYKARAYSPILGRFLQVDPVGYEGGQINLYAYVGNDPLNRSDATGEGATCDSTPGGCGMTDLTPAEEQRRNDAYADVGKAAFVVASALPASRIVSTIVRAVNFARNVQKVRQAVPKGWREEGAKK